MYYRNKQGTLTPRENQISRMGHLTVREISQRLGLTETTVKTYRQNIRRKIEAGETNSAPQIPQAPEAVSKQFILESMPEVHKLCQPQAPKGHPEGVLLEKHFLVLLGVRHVQSILGLMVTSKGAEWHRIGPDGKAELSLPVEHRHIKRVLKEI